MTPDLDNSEKIERLGMTEIVVSRRSFTQALGETLVAVQIDPDPQWPNQCVIFKPHPDGLYLFAGDGYRLVRSSLVLTELNDRQLHKPVLVSAYGLKGISKTLTQEGKGEVVLLKFGEETVRIGFPGEEHKTLSLLPFQPPTWEELIPAPDWGASVSKKLLLKSLREMNLKKIDVNVWFLIPEWVDNEGKGRLIILQDAGFPRKMVEMQIEIVGEVNPNLIKLDLKRLIKSFDSVQTAGDLTLQFSPKSNSIIIRKPNDQNFAHLLMGVR